MSEELNTPKNSSSDAKEERVKIQLPIEFDMVNAYRKKMELLNQQDNQKISIDEPLALILDKDKISVITDHKDFDSLVAFFAVADPKDPLSKNTLVLTGMDEKGKILTYETEHGIFAVAQQTWSHGIKLHNDETSFHNFFQIE